MTREDFIKIIPKPTNENVILYDISLKDLIDVDVINEYNKLLPIYKEEKNKFARLKQEINSYTETINQVFLFNPSWSEEMYLQKLQDDMRTYSTLYGNIKRKKDEIDILQKKINAINDKIIIQKNKEEKEKDEKYSNIKNEIEESKITIIKFEDIIKTYKNLFKKNDEQIKEFKNDLNILKATKEQINKGTYKCFCCGKNIKKDEAETIINNINLSIQKKTTEINLLIEEKSQTKKTLDYYKDQLSKIKINLKNNLAFQRDYKYIYSKKSAEILRLEASKSECLNKITDLDQSLKNEPYINSKKFLELKSRIEKYKVSLENLKKMKNAKAIIGNKNILYKEKQEKLKEKEALIKKYLSFLNIYYKIYEQKASEYAGPDYKIKLFEIKNLDIIKILNITYKGIEYSQLSKRDKETVDKNLIEKFSSDF